MDINKKKRLPWPVAIIAGGKSTRFGSAKINAPFAGKSLVENAVDIAKVISDDFYIIFNSDKHKFPKSWRVYRDIIPECGPIGGLYTALSYSRQKWVVVMPVDMPFLIPEIYSLLDRYRDGKKPVVATSSAGLEPLISIWPKSLLNKIKESIENKHFKLHRLLKECEAVEVNLDKYFSGEVDKILFNINSPRDLKNIP